MHRPVQQSPWEAHVFGTSCCLVADQCSSFPHFHFFLEQDTSIQRFHLSQLALFSFGNAGTHLPGSLAASVIRYLRGERSVRGRGVTAFMLGLGIGSLVGGRLSARFPKHGILIFGVAELGVAIFGLSSLSIFHWIAAYTAGASLGSIIFFCLALLLIPTVLMGATLPLLVEHLVLHTNRVGASVSVLYFVNTFGSAVACYLCGIFLLRNFGQSGSVTIAACINALVGATAYLYTRSAEKRPV